MTADPVALLPTVLRVFTDNTLDEAVALFKAYAEGGGSFAGDALACLDAVLAAPPPDLPQQMKEHGWLELVRETEDGDEIPLTFDEHVAWLRAATERFRGVVRELQHPA